MNPTFTSIATKEVSAAIHLTPQQVTIKIVNDNNGLSAVAGGQGIPSNQLYTIEQRAVNDMLDAEVQAGFIRPEEANAWKGSF